MCLVQSTRGNHPGTCPYLAVQSVEGNTTRPEGGGLGVWGVKPDAEFLDVIGTIVLGVFLLVIHNHLYYRILKPPATLLGGGGGGGPTGGFVF
jgi:hypothetical protein